MQQAIQQRGFTLYELMIVIAIIAILTAIAVPSYRTFIQNNRMVADTNLLSAALQTARSEAVKRGLSVRMQAKTEGTVTAFQNGWDVFVDKNGNNTYDSSADLLLKTQEAFKGSRDLTATRGGASVSQFGFNSRGYVMGLPITFALCDSSRSGESGRQVELANSGRVSVSKITCL